MKNPNTSRPVTIAATLSTNTYGKYQPILPGLPPSYLTTGTHTPKSRSLIQPFCESGVVVEYDVAMFAHTIAAIGISGRYVMPRGWVTALSCASHIAVSASLSAATRNEYIVAPFSSSAGAIARSPPRGM